MPYQTLKLAILNGTPILEEGLYEVIVSDPCTNGDHYMIALKACDKNIVYFGVIGILDAAIEVK